MESSYVCLLVLGLILAVGVQLGAGIVCYECNSKYDAACSDPDRLKTHKPNLAKECGSRNTSAGVAIEYKYCRKYTTDVHGDWRVIRQCATDGRENSCFERAGTQGIKLKYCYCGKDRCNGSPAVFTPITVTLGLITSLAALLLHS